MLELPRPLDVPPAEPLEVALPEVPAALIEPDADVPPAPAALEPPDIRSEALPP